MNVKVTASNYYGESPQSAQGDGASIWVIPDAPVTLVNNALITDASRIGLTWFKGPSNGGTPVLDYRIFYALENDDYTELASSVLQTSYVTSVSLISGERYKFKVQARNAVGFSLDSNEVIIVAARVPDAPTDVTTSIVDLTVMITWVEPYDGGSPLL